MVAGGGWMGQTTDISNFVSSGLNRLRLQPQTPDWSYRLVINGVTVSEAYRIGTAAAVDLEFTVPGSIMTVGDMTEIDLSAFVPPFRVQVGPQQ
jgi:hypothetical protein